MKINERLIVDAIHDAATGGWFKVEGPRGHVWFSGQELISSPLTVREQIAFETHRYLMSSDLQRLATEMNEVTFRDGVVASQSGWSGRTFVCGDGRIFPAGNSVDVVAFDRLAKFAPEGSLADWQATVGPYVEGQTLPLFIIALGLTGALLRFLPSGTLNPIVELAGQPLSGKSTLGMLAASVWAGNPEQIEGGGESWNMTANAFDLRRSDHRDMLLLLDEAEGAGGSDHDRKNLARTVIFTGAAHGRKMRWTDKKRSPAPLRLVLLSTANTSLRDVLVGEPAARLKAAISRVLPIHVDKKGKNGLKLFDKTPASHKTRAKAAKALRRAVDHAYGTAGPAFAEFLAEKALVDEQAFKNDVGTRLDATVDRLQLRRRIADVRQCTTLAAIELSGILAREAGILPVEWGDPVAVVDRIFEQVIGAPVIPSSVTNRENECFNGYLRQQIRIMRFRNTDRAFISHPSLVRQYPGFITRREDGCEELLVDPRYFKQTFAGAHKFLKAARRDRRLRVHPSEPARYQIHAPSWMKSCGFDRIYAITVSDVRLG